MPEPSDQEREQIRDYSHQLLVAAAARDMEAISALREGTEGDWWNVALTLAYLLRDAFSGQPQALEVVAQIFRDAAEGESR